MKFGANGARWPGRLLTALAAVVLGIGLFAAASASGKTHRHRSSYKTHGSSDEFETQGQACFTASWEGHGGWSTDYTAKFIGTDNTPGTIKDDDSSSYSQDVHQRPTAGVGCALFLVRGVHPSGGAIFTAGFVRLNAIQDDTQTGGEEPPVDDTCSKGLITHATGSGPVGSFTTKRKGSSLVFQVTVGLGNSPDCGGYWLPGGRAPGGLSRFNWLESDSTAVPIRAIEHAQKISITVSSDPSHGGLPNCGITDSPGTTCSQTGAWQGTLTLTLARQGR